MTLEAYIQKALAGENALSNPRWNEMSGISVTDYAIPVYSTDGTLRGAMFASDPEDELRAVADNSLFANEGFVQIINCDGSYVVRSQSPLRLAEDSNVFDLPVLLTPEAKQKVLGDAAAGRSTGDDLLRHLWDSFVAGSQGLPRSAGSRPGRSPGRSPYPRCSCAPPPIAATR